MGAMIVVEGIDGSGKGEQIKKLHNYIFEFSKKNRILTTREPTYGKYGTLIRQILRTEEDPVAGAERCFNLYVKDREEHFRNVIAPFISMIDGEDKNVILCDRYYHSTYVFQQAQGIPFNKIYEANRNFLRPTITIILDVPVEVSLERMKKNRKSTEKFEQPEFMEKLRQFYLELPRKLPEENIIIIDGSRQIDEVFEDILKILKERDII